MLEIIDFHTHTFPDYLASRAVDKLKKSANTLNYLNGTSQELSQSNIDSHIYKSVVLPVATRQNQSGEINAKNAKSNCFSDNTGLIYFAAIHPDDSSIMASLSNLKAAGFKGIKLHPVFQDAYIDEKSYLELIDAASSLDLITVIHAGYDISYPGLDYAAVPYILNMLKQVKPQKVVLAHMGGWNEWDMVESDLCGMDVYFDTSFSLTPIRPLDLNKPNSSNIQLTNEQFLRIVKKHGDDKILFGSDSPWSNQAESIECIKNSGLDSTAVDKILSLNAKRLLGI